MPIFFLPGAEPLSSYKTACAMENSSSKSNNDSMESHDVKKPSSRIHPNVLKGVADAIQKIASTMETSPSEDSDSTMSSDAKHFSMNNSPDMPPAFSNMVNSRGGAFYFNRALRPHRKLENGDTVEDGYNMFGRITVNNLPEFGTIPYSSYKTLIKIATDPLPTKKKADNTAVQTEAECCIYQKYVLTAHIIRYEDCRALTSKKRNAMCGLRISFARW